MFQIWDAELARVGHALWNRRPLRRSLKLRPEGGLAPTADRIASIVPCVVLQIDDTVCFAWRSYMDVHKKQGANAPFFVGNMLVGVTLPASRPRQAPLSFSRRVQV